MEQINKTYHEQIYIDNTLRLREILRRFRRLQRLFPRGGTDNFRKNKDFLCV